MSDLDSNFDYDDDDFSEPKTPELSYDDLSDNESNTENVTYEISNDITLDDNIPKKKLEIKRRTEPIKEEIILKPNKITKKEEKLNELEKSFVPHIENIDLMIKGLDHKKLLTKKSILDNDTKLLCLLIKGDYITSSNYKCQHKNCTVKKIWLNKPLQLLIHRKNGIQNDLTPSNLELICPNCYMLEYGYELFKKQIQKTTFNCKYCGYPLIKFNNLRKKGGICLTCEKKLLNLSVEKDEQDYETQVKQLYKDNDLLAEHDINKSKYYKEVSRFKTMPSKPNNYKNLNSLKLAEKSIIIECNTDIGDIKSIDDLIKVESIDSD